MIGNAPVPADDEALASEGDLLLSGQWRVSEGVAKLFGWLLVALADLAAIDHDVVLVRDAVNTDRTKGKRFDAHGSPHGYCSAQLCAAPDAKRPLGCCEGGCDRACCGVPPGHAGDSTMWKLIAEEVGLCRPILLRPATLEEGHARQGRSGPVCEIGATIDFLLSPSRDAAKRLFRKALSDPSHPQPRVINTDEAAIHKLAIPALKEAGILRRRCRHRPVQCMNNIHRAGSSSDQATGEIEAGFSRISSGAAND